MKDNVTLVITSLLSILFMSFHHADDVARGMAPGGIENLVAVVILLVWLYGTLVLAIAPRTASIVLPTTCGKLVALQVRPRLFDDKQKRCPSALFAYPPSNC